MAERNPGRPWTDHEDILLRQGVNLWGDQDHWKDIALLIEGRTNKACRKRWLHSLTPTVKKSAWTKEEDELLIRLYNEYGKQWSLIARNIEGRTDDACSKRYQEALDPDLKKEPFTPEDDEKLRKAFATHGTKWKAVGQELQRSGLACRNRWRLLERSNKRGGGRGAHPYGSPRSRKSPPPLEPSISQETAFQASEPCSPEHISIQLEAPETQDWPYYPPEMYPIISAGESRPTVAFREPTPEVVAVSPKVAPFQFASSSLSAALSAPPPRSRPLPPDPFMPYHHTSHLSLKQHLLYSLGNSHIPPNDITVSLGDFNMDHHSFDSNMSSFTQSFIRSGHFGETHPMVFTGDSTSQDPAMSGGVSPIALPALFTLPGQPESPYPNPNPFHFSSEWNSPQLSALLLPRIPTHSVSSTTTDTWELSSAASTPYPPTAQISPATPNSEIQSDLAPLSNLADISSIPVSPSVGPGGSLLFSVPQAPKRKRKPVATRLSSTLKLSEDPDVRPYACGHEDCWSNEEESSRNCYQTSKDLCDHHRDDHPGVEGYDKFFRCGLQGCGKTWKSVNGLQYHLQVSTVHFKKAVQSRYEADSLQQFVAAATRTADDEEEEAGRKWVCPVPNCFKAYRQPSGLRYHQKHGHAPETFLQFDSVPPALERELPKKAKKMRFRKDNDPMTAASSPSGLAAASPLVSGSAALPSSSNAAAVPA
ncbi:hypothetical protein DFP72DRAFT_865603 [Ephemerocybe angulata]|uniref:Uncharacterized protein n=1 Tax=Ephemerocybe angulata TaxID=980116 RepID=A0A8H6IIK4_9AGAR|nr:hypothetical protein DFP72DRAFT_865603 [Tulosesus angulatus]